jgi:hypothetical protein
VFILYAILVFAALAAVLFIGSIWFQGTIYSEPAAGLSWRAPLAAAVLTAFFVLFRLIAQGENSFNTFFDFSARQTRRYEEFRSVLEQNPPVLYRLAPDGKYKDASGIPWKRATADGIVRKIIVKDDGKEVEFLVELTSDGKFTKNPQSGIQEARYREKDGSREMTENNIGYVTTFRFGMFVGNLMINFAHLFLWFASFWLILRYQWMHALLLAIAAWLPVTLLLLPSLLK